MESAVWTLPAQLLQVCGLTVVSVGLVVFKGHTPKWSCQQAGWEKRICGCKDINVCCSRVHSFIHSFTKQLLNFDYGHGIIPGVF